MTDGRLNPPKAVPSLIQALRTYLSRERAAVSVEFALVTPLAIPLFFGVFELGRAFYNKNMLDYLADEIARAASIQLDMSGIDAAFIDAAMEDALDGLAIFVDPNELERRVEQNGGETTVVLSYPHRLFVPLVLDETITLTSVRILQ